MTDKNVILWCKRNMGSRYSALITVHDDGLDMYMQQEMEEHIERELNCHGVRLHQQQTIHGTLRVTTFVITTHDDGVYVGNFFYGDWIYPLQVTQTPGCCCST